MNYLIPLLLKIIFVSKHGNKGMSFRIILPYPLKSNSHTKQNWFGSKKSFNLKISQPSFFGRESSVETNELQIALGVVSRAQ